jgi:hypothetical protein
MKVYEKIQEFHYNSLNVSLAKSKRINRVEIEWTKTEASVGCWCMKRQPRNNVYLAGYADKQAGSVCSSRWEEATVRAVTGVVGPEKDHIVCSQMPAHSDCSRPDPARVVLLRSYRRSLAGFSGQRLGGRPSFSALTGRFRLEQSWSTLAIAVQSAELVLVGDHWRSRCAALWSVIAGEVDSLLSCCKCDSDSNCRTRGPRSYTFAASCH